MLQWGHVQKDMESKVRIKNRPRIRRLQWGHVQKDMERTLQITVELETSGLQWGHVQKDMESNRSFNTGTTGIFASMGPRPEGHGEMKNLYWFSIKNYMLQWGHVQKDMERLQGSP